MKPRPLDPPMKYESESSRSSKNGDCCTLNTSSLFCGMFGFCSIFGIEDTELEDLRDGDEFECILDNISIFSSFSSSRSFSSRFSASSDRTLSSKDSV